MKERELKDSLIELENLYGGFICDVKRNKVSPNDPRSIEKIKHGGMIGGDRMSAKHHGYAPFYAKHLLKFLNNDFGGVIIEIGILKGSGLAIWSDLFPNNLVYGLDIDLNHTQRNMPNLINKGAFKNNNVELFEYDQFADNKDLLKKILKQKKISILIDDGFHSNKSTLNTVRDCGNYLADEFVCFIEDNSTVHKKIKKQYPHFEVFNNKGLTILS